MILPSVAGAIIALVFVVVLLNRRPVSGTSIADRVDEALSQPTTPDNDTSDEAANDAIQASASPFVATTAEPSLQQTSLKRQPAKSAPVKDPGDSADAILPVRQPLAAAELVRRVEPSVVRINALSESDELEWHGSGFVLDPSGVIATNHHVVAGAHKCVAVFASGETFDVRGYYLMDNNRDIALLQVDLPEGEYQALPLVSSPPAKGEQVLAFGCPYGLDFSTTDGLISALRSSEDLEAMLGVDVEGSWLQTSAPVSPGNSGGPLVNMKGEVVGINSLVRREGQNLNFAISAADVRSLFERRGETLTKLSRGTETEDGQFSLEGSRAADRFLEELDAVHLAVRTRGIESNRNRVLRETVTAFTRKHLRAAGVGVTGIKALLTPMLIITVEAHQGIERGTADVSIAAQLLQPVIIDEDVLILILWEKRGEIGSPKIYKLRKNPNAELNEGLTAFFHEMENEIRTAKRRSER